MKKIAVLGSTGSIGKNTLNVARHLKDEMEISALAAHSNIELLSEQIQEFHPKIVCVFEKDKADEIKSRFPSLQVVHGNEGLEEIARQSDIDRVVIAIVGIAALKPTIAAILAEKTIGLANKEVMVAAGEYICRLAKEKNVQIIPIDSEHSAIFQCLSNKPIQEVKKIILTASGGPFRLHSFEQLSRITLREALSHPTWSMGPKITIDSSTMMNKGLEMVEAKWLFDLPESKIEVVIHPQSIIHSFIEWIDGCIFAEMSEPDMKFPIQYALTYPFRKKGVLPSFDFSKNSKFEFFEPDYKKFPALMLARAALREKSSFACYLNTANEILVERFLKNEISWQQITSRLEKLMNKHTPYSINSVEEVFYIDESARFESKEV